MTRELLEIGQWLEGGVYVGTLNDSVIIMAPKETMRALTSLGEAVEYCDIVAVNGFTDWHLTNPEELNLIHESGLIKMGWFWSDSGDLQNLFYGDVRSSCSDDWPRLIPIRRVSLNSLPQTYGE